MKYIRQEKWHESCAPCRIRSDKLYSLWATITWWLISVLAPSSLVLYA